jgi:hypothetical protein
MHASKVAAHEVQGDGAAWFSTFLLKAFVRRVSRRIETRLAERYDHVRQPRIGCRARSAQMAEAALRAGVQPQQLRIGRTEQQPMPRASAATLTLDHACRAHYPVIVLESKIPA